MADGFRRPDPLIFDGNIAENWRKFELEFDIFIAAAHSEKPDKTKAYILLNLAGPEAIERERSFSYAPAILADNGADIVTPAETREDPECLKRKFREICNPETNVTMERHSFNTRNQNPGETIEAYVSTLRNKAKTCNFGALTDKLIRDRLVCGIGSDNVRRVLLRESDLSLVKAIKICQISELTEQHTKVLAAPRSGPTSVDAVYTREKKAVVYRQQSQQKNTSGTKNIVNCKNCGGNHPAKRDQCKAIGQQCHRCKKFNHFKAQCRSASKENFKSVYQITDANTDSSEESFHIDGLCLGASKINAVNHYSAMNKQEIHCSLTVNGKPLELKIDTGAKCNVISIETYRAVNKEEKINETSKATLVAYGGTVIETKGTVMLQCLTSKRKSHLLEFHVVDKNVKSLLGLPDCLKMNLISLKEEVYAIDFNKNVSLPQEIFTEYAELFDDELGSLPVTYSMKINPDVTPVVRPPRRLPVAMRDKVEAELKNMTKLGVITPISEPTEWVSSMVATHKKDTDKIRLCIDPRDLNEALMRPHHPMRTVEEVAAQMSNANIFSVLDAKSSFWQIKLDHESSIRTTFATPFGRYRFLRMPFGINSASEVFQRAMEQIFAGFPCAIIVDDIIVGGKGEKEHDENLRKVLSRAREVKLKLNPQKCKFRLKEVSYVGHLFTEHGLKPDPAKIKAITEMPPPDDKASLQRFLGMANYLGKFIPNFSELSAPLRQLLHRDIVWCWSHQQQEAFEMLKKCITCPPVLKYFDVSKPVTITCDASQYGLGAACLQNSEPISYASRTLTETERRYAQIEKELLAVVFACQKFYDYIYGKPVLVETDHQPLVSILNKPLHTAPARLQRMILKLHKFNLTLTYKRGKQLYLADTLSRAPRTVTTEDLKDEDEFEVMTVQLISVNRLQELKEHTEKDSSLQSLYNTIKHGWPKKIQSVPVALKPFFPFRDELTIKDGIIMKGTRVAIPQSLQSEYLQILHKGHSGAEATKRRARDAVFWLNMAQDIDNFVQSCSICNALKPHQQKEPLHLHEIPELPWSIVAADIFDWNSQQYLVLVDSYSNWFEINPLRTLSSQNIINKLKKHFSVHGIPQKLITDNGTQFTSQVFRDFANIWDFRHVTSSPEYPQANGLAERAVRSAKRLLETTKRDGTDLYLNLLNIRNIPRDEILGSPAQRLMSRVTRTNMPISKQTLKPRSKDTVKVKAQISKKRQMQKVYFDKRSKPLSPLQKSQVVRMQTAKGHDKIGVVRSILTEPRSYVVESNGKEYRRNRRHLLPVKEPLSHSAEADLEDLLSQLPFEPDNNNVSKGALHAEENIPAEPTAQTLPYRTRYGRISKPNPKYIV